MQTHILDTLNKIFTIVPFYKLKKWDENDILTFENYDELYSSKLEDELSLNLFGKSYQEKCDVIKHYIFETFINTKYSLDNFEVTNETSIDERRLIDVVNGLFSLIIYTISYHSIKNGIDLKEIVFELKIPLKDFDFAYNRDLGVRLGVLNNPKKETKNNKIKVFRLYNENRVNLTKLLIGLKTPPCFIEPTTEIHVFERIFSDSISESKNKKIVWTGSLYELKKFIVLLFEYKIIFKEEKYTLIIENCFNIKKKDLVIDINKEQLISPRGSNRNISKLINIISSL